MNDEKILPDLITSEISNYYSLKSNRDKILLIGHDALRGGAEILLANMIKEFLKQNNEIVLIVKHGGSLLEQYKELVPTFIIDSDNKIEYYIKKLNQIGYQSAILNTVLSANFLPILNKYNFYSISLVHELPGLISYLNAENFVENIADFADFVVFPSSYVCEKFEEIAPVIGKKLIQAQGLYNTYESFDNARARQALEERYNIPKDNNIILNVGAAEKRKGFDLFFEVSQKLKNENYTFIWVGLIKEDIKNEYLEKACHEDNIILTGFISDRDEIMSYYAACDLFFLSSREDPFPSVVLEAFNAKKTRYRF